MANSNIHDGAHERDNIIYGGLLGTNGIVIVQMLQAQSLDPWLHVAIFASAIAIPLLSTQILRTMVEQRFDRPSSGAFLTLARFSGPILTLVVLSALFFHFSILAGVLFMGCVFAAFIAIVRLYGKLRPNA